MLKTLLALLLLVLLGACGDYQDCIYPDSATTISYKVTVKADKTTWTKAGFDVEDDEQLSIEIANNNVDICNQTSTVLVDATHKGSNIRPISMGNGSWIFFFGDGWHISDVKLNVGDTVIFSPIPAMNGVKLTDCDNPPNGFKINDIDACKNGVEIDINGTKKKSEPYEGRSFSVVVGNKLGDPTSNVWSEWPTRKWIDNAPLVIIPDLYDTTDNLPPIPQATLDDINLRNPPGARETERIKELQNFRCGTGRFNSIGPDLRMSSYALNKLCNNLCTRSSNFSECTFAVDLVAKSTVDVDGVNVPIDVDQYFPHLIGTIDDLQNIPDAEPDHDLFVHYNSRSSKSIKANYSYKATKTGTLKLKLDRGGDLSNDIGGYNVNIKRTCTQTSKERLYMYIGDSPPAMDSDGIFASMNSVFKIGDVDEYNINSDNAIKKGDVHFIVKHSSADLGIPMGDFTISTSKPREFNRTISPIIEGVESWVKDTLYGKVVNGERLGGVVTKMYDGIVKKSGIRKIIQAMLGLYLGLYVMFFIMGLIRAPQQELIMSMLKMGILLQLTAQNSWDFFYGYLFSFFSDGTQELITIFSNNGQRMTSHFSFLDSTVGRLFMMETWVQFFGLFFAGPIGWIYVLLILWGFWIYISAVVSAVIVYLMCMVMMGLMFAIAPLFFACILFKYTQKMFTNWIKVLTNNLVQPIMIFAGLSFLNQIMNSVIYNLLKHGVCQDCVIRMEIEDGDIGSFCLLSFPMPIGYEPEESELSRETCFDSIADEHGSLFPGLPTFMTNIIIFVIVASLIKKFITFAAEMADSITENFYGGIGSPGGASHAFEQSIKGVVGQDEASKARRQDRKLYQARYNSLKDPEKVDIKTKDFDEDGKGKIDVNLKDDGGKHEGDSGGSKAIPKIFGDNADSGSAESSGSTELHNSHEEESDSDSRSDDGSTFRGGLPHDYGDPYSDGDDDRGDDDRGDDEGAKVSRVDVNEEYSRESSEEETDDEKKDEKDSDGHGGDD